MMANKKNLNLGFIVGWILVAMAFVGAAHEGGVAGRGLVSTEQLWYAKWPGSLILAQIHVEKLIGQGAWDYTVGVLLILPIWALFGIPAAVCLLYFRPHREQVDYAEAERAHKYADMLARQAKEEGAADDAPRWADLDDLEASEHPEMKALGKTPLDHYMDQWTPEAVEGDELAGLTQGSAKDIRNPGEIGGQPLGIHDLADLKLGDGKGRRRPGELPKTENEEE